MAFFDCPRGHRVRSGDSRVPHRTGPTRRKAEVRIWAISPFERSHPAADASRGMNGAVVACWLR